MTSEELDDLIDRYLSGKASPAEERLIEDFFSSQQKKQTLQHYKLSESMWNSIEENVQQTSGNVHFSLSKKRKTFNKLILACVTILVLNAAAWYSWNQKLVGSADRVNLVSSVTPRGQKSLITLPDGSRVYLNSESSISYPEFFSKDKREITLSGEAFFEVTRDETRPFIIYSGAVTTKVLGTSFNIQAFKGSEIKVTVATGKVQVDVKSDQKNDQVVLTPNQQAVYNREDGLVTKEVSADQFTAWRTNTLYFADASLEDAASILERWYNVKITFENETIKTCRVNGQYKDQTLTGVLKSIQYMYKVDYKLTEENNVLLYGKGCNQ